MFLHLEYDAKCGKRIEHTVSDWTGMLDGVDPDNCPGLWTGDMDVTIDGTTRFRVKCGDHQDSVIIAAQGNEKYGFSLNLDKQGYEISQGYCNTQFGTRTVNCPKDGVSTDDGSVIYSESWKVKIPLPKEGTTLTGKTSFPSKKPGHSDELPKGTTIKVKWKLLPVRRREIKYRETSMDIAAMNYPGHAITPHVYVLETGGGISWLPHSNFAGEVWVDGVNKVEIHPGSAPRDANGRAQNVTSDFMIMREARHWDLDNLGKSTWLPDSPDPIQDWIDNAGVSWVAGPPDTWNRRVMIEFLVQVLGQPEIGRIYAAFVMETRKNAYRICYAESRFLCEEEYNAIIASTTPQFPYPFKDKNEGWVQL